MKLGIVGHAAGKFTPATQIIAKDAIRVLVDSLTPTLIVSGRSPMGGVDLWAEDAAAEFKIPTLIHEPKVWSWGAPGGFKERNLAIARDSDLVLCVVVEKLPPDFAGFVTKGCYHCGDRNPPHVKSGGCWTTWKAPRKAWAIVHDGYWSYVERGAGSGRPET